MKNDRKIKTTTLVHAVASLVALATLPSSAGPLLYDGFDYADSKTSGSAALAGVKSGTGWAGAWTETRHPMPAVAEPGLTFGRLNVKGNACTSSGSSWGHATRATGDTLSKAGLLNDGATLWFSVIIDNSAATSGVKNGLALGTGAFSGEDHEKMAPGVRGIGLLQSTYGKVAAAYWSDGSVIASDTGKYPTQAVLFVGKIEWGATAEANETLTVYAPDTDLNLGSPVATLVIPAVDQSEFDTVALLAKDHGRMDEIRYGASLQDVMGGAGAKPEK